MLKAAQLIRDIPDFPQPGIVFKDITPALGDGSAFAEMIDQMTDAVRALDPDCIIGIESRGFLFGAPIARALGIGFVPFRKAGKLPYQTIREEYALEYGTAVVEAHVDALQPGQRTVIVDDLLATGGTAAAAASLARRLEADLVGFLFAIELSSLPGRALLEPTPVLSLLTY